MSKKIICVDDNAVERTVLSGLLRNIYDVQTVESGKALINVLRNRAFSVSAIMLDLVMPDMDGFEVLRVLRDNAVYRQIPVIVATSENDVDTQVRVMSLGANGYVSKPFNKDLLVYTLENAINLREKSAIANEFRIDRLTGMYNRARFLEVARSMISRCELGVYMLSCVDIENFKVINEQYGSKIGDELLKRVGSLISDCANQMNGISCRDAADKFLVLYPACEKDSDRIRMAHNDVRNVGEAGRPIKIRIGRCLVDDSSIDVGTMCDRATLAEESIKNRFDVYIADYNDSMREKMLSEQAIVAEMDSALKYDEFEPWLQPQYNHQTGAIIGAEALVRWKHEGKYRSPAEFIPIFERNGFIFEMDYYIWEQVCRLLRCWLDEGKNPLPISVNISRRDIFQQNFVGKLTGLVRKHDIPYELLRLEVTESAFAESTGVIIAKVDELIALGFTVEIDDFGSGYSSLNTLKDVPASILKLDMKFFENTENSQRGGNIVESVMRMSKWLGMAVIAEGVEDKAQADYLKSIGCYYIQGYYYARPMPVSDYEHLMEGAYKEHELTRLKTLQTLDSNEFWSSKSMDSLIFNSYVGAACILEYTKGRVEMLRVNDLYIKMLGSDCLSIKDLLKLDWVNHMGSKSLCQFSDAISESVETIKPVSGEYESTGIPGCPESVWLRVTSRAIATAGDRILVYCLNDNITAQKDAEFRQREAERQQYESAQRLEVIMENINGGVSALTIDDDGNSHFVFNNEKYYNLYGYTTEEAEAEGLDVMTLIAPEDLPTVLEKIKKLKADRKPALIDYAITKKDGSRALLRANSSLMSIEGYGDEVITSVLTDITEKRSLETQLRAIVDNIYGAVTATVIRDGKPEFLVVNDNFYHMLGYATKEEYEAEAENKYVGLHPDDRERVIHQFETQDGGKQSYMMEYRIIRKDGALRYIRNNISVISLFGYNDPVQLSVCNDVTEQVEAEEKRRELLDNLPTGAALYEYDGKHLKVIQLNRQYWKLVRREPVEYGNASFMDAVHPNDRQLVMDELAAAVRQGRSIALDIRILCGGDVYEPFHIAAAVTVANDGKYMLYAEYTSISNEAISLQEMLPIALSTMMATSDDISYIKGKDLHYIACSQAIAKMTGHESTRDLIGKNAYDLFDSKYAEKFNEDDKKIIETGKPVIDSIEHIPTSDGGISLARTSKYPVRDAGGEVIGVYCVSHDVTMQRQRESQLDLLSRTIPGGLASYSISKDGIKSIYFNDGFYAYSGYTREEYIALTQDEPLALMHEEDRPAIREFLHSFITEKRDGMTDSCDYRCYTKAGKLRYMSLRAVLTQLDEDKYLLNMVQLDMTEHVEVEQRMENLLDNLPFGAAMYSFDGKSLTAVHINKQYNVMVNRTVNSTLAGFNPVDFIHPDDRQMVLNEVKDSIAHDRDGFCDVRLLYGADEYRTFHLDTRITPQGSGNYLLYVAYTRIFEQELTFRTSLPFIFNTIMESSTDLAFAKDVNFRYLCCSKTFAALLGLSSEQDVVGKTDFELFPREIAELFRKEDSDIIATQKPQIDITEVIPSPDGTKHFTRTSKHLLRDTMGNIVGLYCVGRDVTQTREALQRLELLTNSVPGGIATYTCTDGTIRLSYFNDGFCRLSGYSREEHDSSEYEPLKYVLAEDAPMLHDGIVQLLNDEEPFERIFRIRTKSGGVKWVNCQARVCDHVKDEVIINALLTDVTAAQEEKERLRISEERNLIALEHSGNIITHLDVAGRTLTMPANLPAIYEVPPVLQNMPEEQIELGRISPDTADAYRGMFESIYAGTPGGSATYQQHSTKGWRWLLAKYTTVFAVDGSPASAVISFKDITDQQEKEAVYTKWQQNLHDRKSDSYTLFRCNLNRNSSFDSMEGTLLGFDGKWDDSLSFNEHTDDFARHFVSDEDQDRYLEFVNSDTMLASYYRGKRRAELEFRGIISTGDLHWIRLSVELVEYPNTSDIAAYLMYEDINDTKVLSLQTKALAETDPLTGLLNRKAFIEMMNQKLEQQNPGTYCGMLLIDMDGFKLVNDSYGHSVGDQVLIDTGKAIRSVLRGSDLVCRMGGDEFLVCLSSMLGKDIIMKKAMQIWESVHKSFNLDVRISVSIGISVSPGDGSGFELLYLKADKALYHVKENGKDNCVFYNESMNSSTLLPTTEPCRTASHSELTERKPKILIVDDNQVNRKLLKNLLIDDYDPETVSDGFSALQYIRKNAASVSVILLDLVMPDMDGFAVLQRLRENDEAASIPVIVVSGMDERDAALRVIQAGASDFVTKPVDPTLLRIRVQSAISRAENERLRAQNRYLSLIRNNKQA